MIQNLIDGDNLSEELSSILLDFHANGPVDSSSLEKLAYAKKFHPEIFKDFETKFLHAMGLFYKVQNASSILEEVYSTFSKAIELDTGRKFTPVQASLYHSIKDKKYYSFSAPTSAGKSYLFREIIQETKGDIVIVVPSRALISEYYLEIISLTGNDVLVLQFIEDVNRDLIRRRIFIVTPERATQLFKQRDKFNIELFMLDEAQLSEEEFRGLRFDALVRRISRTFPHGKMVFAHPFVENPEAQLQKHGFSDNSAAKNFNQQSVGKIFIHYNNGHFTHFSPNCECKEVPCVVDIARETLANNKTLLIYISKNKIYDGSYRLAFGNYVDMCPKLEDEKTLKMIKSLREFIGAQENGPEKHSNLIELMERGVVTHHGSMPLKARLIVEQFIKEGLAKICFATSTLNQGINMPFDAVWVDNFRNVKDLTLKNLIGRAGRTSARINEFDFGHTIINKKNVSSFTERYRKTYRLNPFSLLDANTATVDEDSRDIIDSIKANNFNDDLQLPEIQITRIKSVDIDSSVKFVLDNLLANDKPITGHEYYKLPDNVRKRVKECFKTMFIVHLRRTTLEAAEYSVLSAAIPIMLWHIQGRSFAEIISLRHSFLTSKSEQRRILSLLKSKDISEKEANKLWNKLTIRYSQVPSPIPNKKLSRAPSFPREHIEHLDYDSLVYDTYDYLDKVISLSLTDPICAVLEFYFQKHNDKRARALINYIRFGTNDHIEIWLIKYGFSFDDIEWIKEHVISIDNSRIDFNDSVRALPP